MTYTIWPRGRIFFSTATGASAFSFLSNSVTLILRRVTALHAKPFTVLSSLFCRNDSTKIQLALFNITY